MKLLDWTTKKQDFHGGAKVVVNALKRNPNPWGKINMEFCLVSQQLSRCDSGMRARVVKILEALNYGKERCSNQCLQVWVKALEQLANGDGPQGVGNAVQECLGYRKQTPSTRRRIRDQLVDIGLARDSAIRVFDGYLLSEEELRRGGLARLEAIGQTAWTYL
ncbi:hypothetical protein Micbo1qcDRAFT_161538, partial [Microdochium bolleyi]